MSTKRDDFNRKNAANKRALTDLHAKANALDLKRINEKVRRNRVLNVEMFEPT